MTKDSASRIAELEQKIHEQAIDLGVAMTRIANLEHEVHSLTAACDEWKHKYQRDVAGQAQP